ncbi:hypothetical protein [Dongshaea marina]|uniref:hypothetical protein n=1 Tax=Dongshaea marina TaxID=2047966 RepID=UPI000D3ED70C|nr:hypothetical protein [Dongshaea marina]
MSIQIEQTPRYTRYSFETGSGELAITLRHSGYVTLAHGIVLAQAPSESLQIKYLEYPGEPEESFALLSLACGENTFINIEIDLEIYRRLVEIEPLKPFIIS